eukprot:gene12336-8464_t
MPSPHSHLPRNNDEDVEVLPEWSYDNPEDEGVHYLPQEDAAQADDGDVVKSGAAPFGSAVVPEAIDERERERAERVAARRVASNPAARLFGKMVPYGGILASGLNLASSSIGAGIIAVPQACQCSGMVMALFYLVVVALLTVLSYVMIGEAGRRTGLRNYAQVVRALMGPGADYFLAFCLWFLSFGAEVSYVISLGDVFRAFLTNSDHVSDYWKSTSGVRVVTFLVWLGVMRNEKCSSYASISGFEFSCLLHLSSSLVFLAAMRRHEKEDEVSYHLTGHIPIYLYLYTSILIRKFIFHLSTIYLFPYGGGKPHYGKAEDDMLRYSSFLEGEWEWEKSRNPVLLRATGERRLRKGSVVPLSAFPCVPVGSPPLSSHRWPCAVRPPRELSRPPCSVVQQMGCLYPLNLPNPTNRTRSQKHKSIKLKQHQRQRHQHRLLHLCVLSFPRGSPTRNSSTDIRDKFFRLYTLRVTTPTLSRCSSSSFPSTLLSSVHVDVDISPQCFQIPFTPPSPIHNNSNTRASTCSFFFCFSIMPHHREADPATARNGSHNDEDVEVVPEWSYDNPEDEGVHYLTQEDAAQADDGDVVKSGAAPFGSAVVPEAIDERERKRAERVAARRVASNPAARLFGKMVPYGGILASGLNLASSSIGAGIIAVPQACQCSGMVMALFYLVVVALLTVLSYVLIGKAGRRTGLRNYAQVVRALLGPGADYFLAFCLWFLSFGAEVSYVISLGDVFRAFLTNSDHVSDYWKSTSGVRVVTFLVWLGVMRNEKCSSYASISGFEFSCLLHLSSSLVFLAAMRRHEKEDEVSPGQTVGGRVGVGEVKESCFIESHGERRLRKGSVVPLSAFPCVPVGSPPLSSHRWPCAVRPPRELSRPPCSVVQQMGCLYPLNLPNPTNRTRSQKHKSIKLKQHQRQRHQHRLLHLCVLSFPRGSPTRNSSTDIRDKVMTCFFSQFFRLYTLRVTTPTLSRCSSSSFPSTLLSSVHVDVDISPQCFQIPFTPPSPIHNNSNTRASTSDPATARNGSHNDEDVEVLPEWSYDNPEDEGVHYLPQEDAAQADDGDVVKSGAAPFGSAVVPEAIDERERKRAERVAARRVASNPAARLFGKMVPYGGILASGLNLASSSIGAGIIAVPQACQCSGMVMALFYLVVVALLTVLSYVLIGKAGRRTGLRNYAQVVRALLGPGADYFLAFCLWFLSFGAEVSYVISLGDVFRAFLTNSDHVSDYWKSTSGVRVVTFLVWLGTEKAEREVFIVREHLRIRFKHEMRRHEKEDEVSEGEWEWEKSRNPVLLRATGERRLRKGSVVPLSAFPCVPVGSPPLSSHRWPCAVRPPRELSRPPCSVVQQMGCLYPLNLPNPTNRTRSQKHKSIKLKQHQRQRHQHRLLHLCVLSFPRGSPTRNSSTDIRDKFFRLYTLRVTTPTLSRCSSSSFPSTLLSSVHVDVDISPQCFQIPFTPPSPIHNNSNTRSSTSDPATARNGSHNDEDVEVLPEWSYDNPEDEGVHYLPQEDAAQADDGDVVKIRANPFGSAVVPEAIDERERERAERVAARRVASNPAARLFGKMVPYGGILASGLNLASSSIGAGIIAVPQACQCSGMVMALFYLVVVALLTVLSYVMIGEAGRRTGLRNYARVVRALMGPGADYFLAFCLWFLSFGAEVSYVISLGDVFRAFLTNSDHVSDYWKSTSGVRVVTFLVWLGVMRNEKCSSYASISGFEFSCLLHLSSSLVFLAAMRRHEKEDEVSPGQTVGGRVGVGEVKESCFIESHGREAPPKGVCRPSLGLSLCACRFSALSSHRWPCAVRPPRELSRPPCSVVQQMGCLYPLNLPNPTNRTRSQKHKSIKLKQHQRQRHQHRLLHLCVLSFPRGSPTRNSSTDIRDKFFRLYTLRVTTPTLSRCSSSSFPSTLLSSVHVDVDISPQCFQIPFTPPSPIHNNSNTRASTSDPATARNGSHNDEDVEVVPEWSYDNPEDEGVHYLTQEDAAQADDGDVVKSGAAPFGSAVVPEAIDERERKRAERVAARRVASNPAARLFGKMVPYGGILASGLNLASSSIGAGIIAVPQACQCSGMVMALFYLVVVALLTVLSYVLIGKAGRRTGLRNYAQVVRALLGPGADYFLAFCLWFLSFGAEVSYVISLGDVFRAFLTNSDHVSDYWKSTSGVRVVTFLVWLGVMRNEKCSSYASISGFEFSCLLHLSSSLVFLAAMRRHEKEDEVSLRKMRSEYIYIYIYKI